MCVCGGGGGRGAGRFLKKTLARRRYGGKNNRIVWFYQLG